VGGLSYPIHFVVFHLFLNYISNVSRDSSDSKVTGYGREDWDSNLSRATASFSSPFQTASLAPPVTGRGGARVLYPEETGRSVELTSLGGFIKTSEDLSEKSTSKLAPQNMNQ
jgi:hypothetical protein